MIKLVVSDLDGTLIDNEEVLSKKAIRVIKKLKEKGIHFTIASGRVESMCEEYVKELEIDIPYIAGNGATIKKKDTLLKKSKIAIRNIKPLFQKADELGMSIIYSIDGVEIPYKTTPWIISEQEEFDRYHNPHYFIEEEWKNIYIDKLMIVDDEESGDISILVEMRKGLKAYCSFTQYGNRVIEVVDKDSTKASALRELVGILGIELEDVLAIGDHQNDIEMIDEAGIGVSVSNGVDEVKQVADYVTKRCCSEGVIEAIEKFVLNKL